MNNAAASLDTASIRRALDSARFCLDRGLHTAAEAWLETAIDLLREQQITAECDLVAPKDGPTWGDAAVVAVSALVIAWLLVDSAWSLL